ncbi:expressed protein [Phakopsora pachyrhizi]|uniref:Expressed protein n=1 Tax=Phakopsora pachyrhizi TaxID=170000 RepID=A0AAV0ALU4_PHAPC|nr:expressed protein [Phakopsora pachyrhizi]
MKFNNNHRHPLLRTDSNRVPTNQKTIPLIGSTSGQTQNNIKSSDQPKGREPSHQVPLDPSNDEVLNCDRLVNTSDMVINSKQLGSQPVTRQRSTAVWPFSVSPPSSSSLPEDPHDLRKPASDPSSVKNQPCPETTRDKQLSPSSPTPSVNNSLANSPKPVESPNSSQSNLNWSWFTWRTATAGSGEGIVTSGQESRDQPDIVGPGTRPSSGSISLLELPSTARPTEADPIHHQTPDSASYPSRLGSWVYSWYRNGPADRSEAPASGAGPLEAEADQPRNRTTKILDSVPNPIVSIIPETSGGWANYFSSRRPIPGTKKIEETERRSVESMEIDTNAIDGDQPMIYKDNRPKELRSSSSLLSFNLGKKRAIGQHEDAGPPSSPSSNFSQRNMPMPTSKVSGSNPDPQKASVLPPLTDSTLSSSQPNKKITTRPISNMVLPSFEDTFMSPPRSFYPQTPSSSSMLKQTFGLVQAYIFPIPPEFPQTVAGDEEEGNSTGSERRTKKKKRKVIEIFEQNKHKSTRLPRCYDLLGIDRVERLKKIKQIVIVGIHGWFPGPWLETVIGKPTGTSKKFAAMMEESLKRYVEKQLGAKLNPEAITIIPLEGEGKVDKRAEMFHQKLCSRSYWLDKLRVADAVFFVSHSQGTLVSCKLIERLIKEKMLRGDRVLSLCMCGIWNGPYVGLNSSYALQPMLKLLEGPAAHELFEFQDNQTSASKALSSSLNSCLLNGVKLLLVGSLNDQVVPLHSALNTDVDHPAIVRTIFVDSEAYKSIDFLTNLMVFCQRLRNSGLSDHGLPSFLSEGFIGSLSGVGHSTVYEEPKVFDFAVRYFFEVTSTLEYPTSIQSSAIKSSNSFAKPIQTHTDLPLINSDNNKTHSSVKNVGRGTVMESNKDANLSKNPFMITWILRGLIEDQKIKLLFGYQLRLIRLQLDEWKVNNNNKILKDLKSKLEPLKLYKVKKEFEEDEDYEIDFYNDRCSKKSFKQCKL